MDPWAGDGHRLKREEPFVNDIFYERKSGNAVRSLWRWAGALCIPAALSVLVQLLHS